jgi:hypothetical protein
VGVIVGVSVGIGVFVGVYVKVGVGVSVANNALSGLLGPVNQTTNKMIPTRINKVAPPQIMNAWFCWRRFRYLSITLRVDFPSFMVLSFISNLPRVGDFPPGACMPTFYLMFEDLGNL